jgi:hypothetical protein
MQEMSITLLLVTEKPHTVPKPPMGGVKDRGIDSVWVNIRKLLGREVSPSANSDEAGELYCCPIPLPGKLYHEAIGTWQTSHVEEAACLVELRHEAPRILCGSWG